jgi:hypothetical protein
MSLENKKLKRINRKKLIEELEFLRQGFFSAIHEAKKNNDNVAMMSFDAYHKNADRLIVELGGESTRDIIEEIYKAWENLTE